LARFYYRNVVRRVLTVIAGIIERGIAQGEFRRDIDPRAAAPLAMAPLLMAAIWRQAFERHAAGDLDVAAMLTTHVQVFLRGLRAEAGGRP